MQVCNFALAYYALKKILFEPGLALLQKRKKKRVGLNQDIVSLQESIATKEVATLQRWQRFRKKIADQKPHVILMSLRDDSISRADRRRIVGPEQEIKLVRAMKNIILNHVEKE